MNLIEQNLLESIADLHGTPTGAYNIRRNGEGAGRQSTENIIITTKTDKPGIDITIKPFTKNESVHIPVLVTESGITDLVYNDFYVGEGADVVIVAGCGIHNDGSGNSEHDGIHNFHIGKGARLRYVEKHYGEGDGKGERILNPTTIVTMEEDSYCEMEMVQIKGVDSTVRETSAHLGKNAKMVMVEKTHDARKIKLRNRIWIFISTGKTLWYRLFPDLFAKETSEQVFHPGQSETMHAGHMCSVIPLLWIRQKSHPFRKLRQPCRRADRS
jgi:hypothetical protein